MAIQPILPIDLLSSNLSAPCVGSRDLKVLEMDSTQKSVVIFSQNCVILIFSDLFGPFSIKFALNFKISILKKQEIHVQLLVE